MKFSIFSNKGKRNLKIPDTWDSLSTAAYIRLIKDWDGKDLVKAFSALTGIPFKNLFDTKDPELEAQLTLATSFLFSQPQDFKKAPLPEWFEYDDRKFRTKDLALSIGQSIQVRQKLDSCKYQDEAIAYAIATVIQPQIDGEVNSDRVDQLEAFILELPITKTYQVGFFLLKPLMKAGRTTLLKWSLLRTIFPLSKRGKMWRNWQRSKDLNRIST